MDSIIDIKGIYKALPHRYPMLFVDGITKIEYGKHVEGFKNVSMNEPWVTGHFTDEPILPGIFIIEIMAQIGGFMFYEKDNEENQLKAYLSGANHVRFIHKVYPGDQIRVEASFMHKLGKVIKANCDAYVGEKKVAKAQISYYFESDIQLKEEPEGE